MAKKQSAKKEAQDKKNLANGNRFKTNDEATRKAASKGGKKSQEVQRRRRNMREDVKALLSMPMSPEMLEDIGALQSLPQLADSNVTAQELMLYTLIIKGLKGDRESIKLVFEMTGDNTEENTDNDAVLDFIRSLTK
jgi:hypothetical protein